MGLTERERDRDWIDKSLSLSLSLSQPHRRSSQCDKSPSIFLCLSLSQCDKSPSLSLSALFLLFLNSIRMLLVETIHLPTLRNQINCGFLASMLSN